MSLTRTKGLQRTPFKRAEPKPVAGPRMVKCKNRACRQPFLPDRPFVKHCSPDCGAVLGMEANAKRAAAKAKADRADIKRRKQAIKTIPQLKADLQDVFNLCMRLEDEAAGNGCICCGKFPTAAALAQLGGAWDCCHFRSRGSADHLRYNEDNAWRGLKDCNTWGHTDYRGGLIKRIGIERVEALESNQTGMKWTREWLEEKRVHYLARVRALRAAKD